MTRHDPGWGAFIVVAALMPEGYVPSPILMCEGYIDEPASVYTSMALLDSHLYQQSATVR